MALSILLLNFSSDLLVSVSCLVPKDRLTVLRQGQLLPLHKERGDLLSLHLCLMRVEGGKGLRLTNSRVFALTHAREPWRERDSPD